MKDVLEIISSILGIIISCITIYQFFAQRPSVVRLRREKTSQLSQEPRTVPAVTEVSVRSVPEAVERAHTRKYFFSLITFIIMAVATFFILALYTNVSGYSYDTQEAELADITGALLAAGSIALMTLLVAPSRRRAIFAVTTFAIVYCLVLLELVILYRTFYFTFPILDSSLAGGNVLAVILASLVAFTILRGTSPSRQQYIFSLIAFVLVLLVTFLGPILWVGFSVTVKIVVGGSAIALIAASISALTILFSRSTNRTYTIVLVLFTIVYVVVLLLLAVIRNRTYNDIFYIFDEASLADGVIAFLVGGSVAFIFLKSREAKRQKQVSVTVW